MFVGCLAFVFLPQRGSMFVARTTTLYHLQRSRYRGFEPAIFQSIGSFTKEPPFFPFFRQDGCGTPWQGFALNYGSGIVNRYGFGDVFAGEFGDLCDSFAQPRQAISHVVTITRDEVDQPMFEHQPDGFFCLDAELTCDRTRVHLPKHSTVNHFIKFLRLGH